MNKIRFLFLGFAFFLFSCNHHKKDAIEIKQLVNSIYSEQKNLYEMNIDSSEFSRDLESKMNETIHRTMLDEMRIKNSESPTDKPYMIEGSVLSSLYDGYSKYEIKEIRIFNHSAKVVVEFENKSSTPILNWKDTLVLINEGGWKLDNVIYNKKNTLSKDLKGVLIQNNH